jgi:hypothetical protein
MAIKINNVTAIDDSRNVSAGIVTVGSGSSATIINGTTGTVNIGTGITIVGSSGDISIAGTITAGGFNIPASIVTYSPAIGSTVRQDLNPSFSLTFNQAVGVATTGTILIKAGAAGTTLQTLGVGNIRSIPNGISIILNQPAPISQIVPVIPNGLIRSTSGNFAGLNTTGANSYNFTLRNLQPGDSISGGFLLCQAAAIRWIVAPSSSEVARTWDLRDDASTRAQAVTGCTGWFVPTVAQLQNPGYACRTGWDSYSSGYWSSTQLNPAYGCNVDMNTGAGGFGLKFYTIAVRSFRCVAY